MGPSKLRFLEVNVRALKPVYLRYRILEVGLMGPEAGPEASPETGPGSGPGSGPR